LGIVFNEFSGLTVKGRPCL